MMYGEIREEPPDPDRYDLDRAIPTPSKNDGEFIYYWPKLTLVEKKWVERKVNDTPNTSVGINLGGSMMYPRKVFITEQPFVDPKPNQYQLNIAKQEPTFEVKKVMSFRSIEEVMEFLPESRRREVFVAFY